MAQEIEAPPMTERTTAYSMTEAPKLLPVLLLGTVQATSEADGHAVELAFDHDQGLGSTH